MPVTPDGISIAYTPHAVPYDTLSVLPNVRHLTPIECPEAIADKILALVKQL